MLMLLRSEQGLGVHSQSCGSRAPRWNATSCHLLIVNRLYPGRHDATQCAHMKWEITCSPMALPQLCEEMGSERSEVNSELRTL